MIDSRQIHDSVIPEALSQSFPAIRKTDSGSWSFDLSNGSSSPVLRGTTRIQGDWLLFNARPANGRQRSRVATARLREALALNAHVPGGVKFILSPDGRSLHLAAEVPFDGVEEKGGLSSRIGKISSGFQHAAKGHPGTMPTKGAHDSPNDSSMSLIDGAPPELLALMTEAAWPFAKHASGQLMVELEVLHLFYQAAVRMRTGGDIQVAVDLLNHKTGALQGPCQRALDILLLTACGIVRMARAVLHQGDDRTTAGFEVVLSPPCTPSDLKHAFSALSVACRLCGEEAKVLQEEEDIAHEYLSIRGWSS